MLNQTLSPWTFDPNFALSKLAFVGRGSNAGALGAAVRDAIRDRGAEGARGIVPAAAVLGLRVWVVVLLVADTGGREKGTPGVVAVEAECGVRSRAVLFNRGA